jgi:hypothetical protein
MQFPLLFGVADTTTTTTATERVSVFQSSLVREGPDRWGDSPSIYHIAPYRIFHGAGDRQYPDDAFMVAATERRTRRPNHHIMLVADLPAATADPTRQVLYHGNWEHTGRTVFSMYCSTPIPVLEFPTRRGTWAIGGSPNRLPLTTVPAGSESAFVRTWQRRWDPDVWETELADATAAGGARGAELRVTVGRGHHRAAPAPVLEPPPPSHPSPPSSYRPSSVAPVVSHSVAPVVSHSVAPVVSHSVAIATHLPGFVANALVDAAITRGELCPITMEPIAEITTSVAVTSCYHVFDHAALLSWMATGDGSCPVCKAPL